MRAVETRGPMAYCLFTCAAGRLAVGVDAVEAVVEADRLVRLPLCPPPVSALSIYRGGILPIAGPIDDPQGRDAAPRGRLPAVLVLRTSHGPLGLLIDRRALAVVEDGQLVGPAGHEAGRAGESPLPGGLVAGGSIELEGRPHPVLDVDRTWTSMRGMIEAGYGAGREDGS